MTTASFQCEKCGSRQTGTTDTRAAAYGCTRRRRVCQCGHKFTTYEVDAKTFELLGRLKSGRVRQHLEAALLELPRGEA